MAALTRARFGLGSDRWGPKHAMIDMDEGARTLMRLAAGAEAAVTGKFFN